MGDFVEKLRAATEGQPHVAVGLAIGVGIGSLGLACGYSQTARLEGKLDALLAGGSAGGAAGAALVGHKLDSLTSKAAAAAKIDANKASQLQKQAAADRAAAERYWNHIAGNTGGPSANSVAAVQLSAAVLAKVDEVVKSGGRSREVIVDMLQQHAQFAALPRVEIQIAMMTSCTLNGTVSALQLLVDAALLEFLELLAANAAGGAAVTRSDLYKVSMTAGFSLQDLIELDPATSQIVAASIKLSDAAAAGAAAKGLNPGAVRTEVLAAAVDRVEFYKKTNPETFGSEMTVAEFSAFIQAEFDAKAAAVVGVAHSAPARKIAAKAAQKAAPAKKAAAAAPAPAGQELPETAEELAEWTAATHPGKMVVVAFSTSFCSKCRANAGPVKALVTEAGGVLIKADAEEDDSELFLNLNIGGGVPRYVVYKGGQKTGFAELAGSGSALGNLQKLVDAAK